GGLGSRGPAAPGPAAGTGGPAGRPLFEARRPATKAAEAGEEQRARRARRRPAGRPGRRRPRQRAGWDPSQPGRARPRPVLSGPRARDPGPGTSRPGEDSVRLRHTPEYPVGDQLVEERVGDQLPGARKVQESKPASAGGAPRQGRSHWDLAGIRAVPTLQTLFLTAYSGSLSWINPIVHPWTVPWISPRRRSWPRKLVPECSISRKLAHAGAGL